MQFRCSCIALLALSVLGLRAAETRSIYGIHDATPDPSEYLNRVKTVGSGGWVTATVAIGHNAADTTSQSFSSLTNAGHTVICRLNNGYFPDGTIPLPAEYDNFARRCSNFVMNSSGCNIWVIGNETNLKGEWPFSGTNFAYISPQQYALCFRKVYNAIKAVRPNDRVLPSPPSPFAGPYGAGTQNGYPADGVPINWVQYLNQELTAIAASGPLDGVALHVTSRGYAYSDIHSTSKASAGGQSLYFSFYVYKDWVEKGIPPALYHLPIYVTECNGYYYWKGGHPENTAKHYEPGFMQEVYAEINRYNQHAAGAGKPIVRCLNMYRWCAGCDGWNIDGSSNPYKAQILSDLDAAVAQNYRWPDGTANRTNLVSTGALWRYLDNGSDQSTAWRGTNFNDSSWAQGLAQLGYGDNDETTVVNGGPSASRYITTYFRRAFAVPDASFYTNLVLRSLRDDGVVIYLNGSEIYGDNMPAGGVTYLTKASTAISGADETNFYTGSVSLSLLRTGTNFITAEIHQSDTNSSDISFDLELIGRGNAPPSVSIIQPVNGSVLGAPTNLLVAANVTDDYAVARVDWWMNGVRIQQQTLPPFALTLTNLAAGVYTFESVASDGVLMATSPPVNIALHAALVRQGSLWRYLDNGSDQGTAWRGVNFNDTAWPSGLAQLGYGDGDEKTTLNFGDSANKYVTSYFRQRFPAVDPNVFTNLLVRLLRDDGGVVYLNGVEVFRSNMPLSNPITYLTLAASTAGGEDETTLFYPMMTSPGVLMTGTNVAAVEIHQSDRTSSDVSFDFELLGLGPSPLPLLSAVRSANAVLLSWPAGAGPCALEATTTLFPSNWAAVNTTITYRDNRFEMAVAALSGQRFFRLVPR
jgi:hypothetical protein